jgi:hypothetical protein
LAIVEIKAILAGFLLNFDIGEIEGKEVKMKTQMTVGPDDDQLVHFTNI